MYFLLFVWEKDGAETACKITRYTSVNPTLAVHRSWRIKKTAHRGLYCVADVVLRREQIIFCLLSLSIHIFIIASAACIFASMQVMICICMLCNEIYVFAV
jgi:hypothetical protein